MKICKNFEQIPIFYLSIFSLIINILHYILLNIYTKFIAKTYKYGKNEAKPLSFRISMIYSSIKTHIRLPKEFVYLYIRTMITTIQ